MRASGYTPELIAEMNKLPDFEAFEFKLENIPLAPSIAPLVARWEIWAPPPPLTVRLSFLSLQFYTLITSERVFAYD
jgi:hypothetical protein